MNTKPCLRCGLPVEVDNKFDVEYTECLSCGFEWEWDGQYIRAWLRDDGGKEIISEVPEGCLLVVESV